MEELYSMCCGICFMEEGRSIRGQIDSCDHYFCFVCIMEWSKIESKCPMCKKRFTTIRRPPKDGVFSSERIVNVPKRDQTYNGLVNASIGPFDPYQHVSCSVCHGVTDESVLLLCDLCDMAAHTYCVGLGAAVPEGDWFCHDCILLRAEHNNTEIDSGGDSQDIFGNSRAELNNTRINIDGGSQNMIPNSESENYNADVIENSDVIAPTDAHVSIVDIVHEELNTGRSFQITSSLPDRPSPSVVSGAGSRRPYWNNPGKSAEAGARTLHLCRNVQSRIQVLRENWNKLQSGSLRFSSSSIESGGESSKRLKISKMLHDRSGQPQSSSSQGFQQPRAQDGLLGGIIQDNYGSSFDVNKAWKMMKIAKSMSQTRGIASGVHQASNIPSVKGYALQQATNTTSSSINIAKKQQSGKCDIRSIRTEKLYSSYSNERVTQNHRSLKTKLQERSNVMTEESFEGVGTRPSTQLFGSTSFTNTQTQSFANQVNGARSVAEDVFGASSSVAHKQGASSCSLNLVESVLGTSNSSNSKSELNASSSSEIDTPERKDMLGKGHMQSKASKSKLNASSSSKIDTPERKDMLGKGHMQSKASKSELNASSSSKIDTLERKDMLGKGHMLSKARKDDDDAKSEIQSLVKLNLKLLCRDKKLETDKFKEVARLATHTILAACGLEHRKSGIHTFPILVACSHSEDIKQIHKSTLLPNSCRECFYVFVKDAVHSIMLEEEVIDHGKLS